MAMNTLCRPTIAAAPSVVYQMMLVNGISLETKYADNVLKIASAVALSPKKSEKRKSSYSAFVVGLTKRTYTMSKASFR